MAERHVVTLKCSTCKHQNYYIERGKKKGDRAKVEVNKYCPNCGRHARHVEAKL